MSTKEEKEFAFGIALMTSPHTAMDIGTVRAVVQEMNSRAPGDQARDARRGRRSASARQ